MQAESSRQIQPKILRHDSSGALMKAGCLRCFFYHISGSYSTARTLPLLALAGAGYSNAPFAIARGVASGRRAGLLLVSDK
jgi:hypothetical protein